MRLRLLTAVLLLLALVAVACGGDEADVADAGGEAEDVEADGADAEPVDEEPVDEEPVADEEEVAAVEPVTLRFSCSCVPEDHHTKAIYKFEEEVEAATDGSVQVEVFDSGSLMDQTGEQTALLRGDLDMAYASSQWVSERVPAAGVVGVPYLIRDVEHLYEVMDGEVGQELFDTVVAEAGIRPLTSLYLGTRHLNLRDIGRQVMTPQDLEGVKLPVPDSEIWIRMGEALGANPTPVAFGELYLALQTGTVDGQDNPLPTTRNAKFYEVTNQVALTGHLVNDVWPTINEKSWQKLSPEQQDAVREAWLAARDYATDIALEAESEAAAFFEEQGLAVYEPDVEAFRAHVLPQYLEDESVTGGWPEGMVERIEEQAE